MIKTVTREKDSSLEVGQDYPKTSDIKGVGVCEIRVYLNLTEYLVVSKPMREEEIESELKMFGINMALEDRIKVSKHLFDTNKVIRKSHQSSYGDNSDEAVLARAVLNHESVINTNPSKLEFRRLSYSIGVEKGFSRAVINACVCSYA